jgi:hypothetical protein
VSRLSTKQRRARSRARPLRVFHDDYEWWVARDVEHARQLQRQETGMDPREQLPSDEWSEEPLDKLIWWDRENGGSDHVTFGQIVREQGGPGFLGSTES